MYVSLWLVGWLVGWLVSWLVGWFIASKTMRVDSRHCLPSICHHLIGLVVRRPPQEWKIPGSNPACDGIFLGSSHTSDLKIGTPVATLPGAWRFKVSAGTGQPGVSIL